MLTPEQRTQFSEIFEELAKSLDITKREYENAVTSYQFVGSWLADKNSLLAPYRPEIFPQGSFLLGTMVRPVKEGDDLDIDLVCRLLGKKAHWTQYDLKQAIGNRLKDHQTIRRMLRKEEGRRCWTLDYAEEACFHMDILPALVGQDYQILLEKAFSNVDVKNLERLAIRITDREMLNYRTATDPLEWLVSNMFGYAVWFQERATIDLIKSRSFSESIKPVPPFQERKNPLQRIVQILKRHRDIMFCGDEDKPISIIITTLAARAYRKQTDIITGLQEVVMELEKHIEDRYDYTTGCNYKYVANPVNPLENFADKWLKYPKRQEKFYQWLRAIKHDIIYVTNQRGIPMIQESLNKPFGSQIVAKAFSNIGKAKRNQREQGKLWMAGSTGMLANDGRTSVSNHSFYGSNE